MYLSTQQIGHSLLLMRQNVTHRVLRAHSSEEVVVVLLLSYSVSLRAQYRVVYVEGGVVVARYC